MAEQARNARQEELAEERSRQYRCYAADREGVVIPPEDEWDYRPGFHGDYCARRADRIVVLSPEEIESIELYCKYMYARWSQCEANEGIAGIYRGRCDDRQHGERYRAHQSRHGFQSAGNGKFHGNNPCPAGTEIEHCECCRHPYRGGRNFAVTCWQR